MRDKLSNVSETVLAGYLKNEYPQTVAVILHKLRSDHAARVLAELPQELATDVVMRMLRMDTVQKDVILRVEQTLKSEFMSNLSRAQRRDPHETMAEVFNALDRSDRGSDADRARREGAGIRRAHPRADVSLSRIWRTCCRPQSRRSSAIAPSASWRWR